MRKNSSTIFDLDPAFEGSIPSHSLQTQWHELRYSSDKQPSNIWRKIHVEYSFPEVRRVYHRQWMEIQDAATALKIELVVRIEEREIVRNHLLGSGPKVRKPKESQNLLEHIFSCDDDSDTGLEQLTRNVRRTRIHHHSEHQNISENAPSCHNDSDTEMDRPPRKVQRTRRSNNIPSTPVHSPRVQEDQISMSNPLDPFEIQLLHTSSWTLRTGGFRTPLSINKDEAGAKTRKRPQLLFRFFNSESQGVNEVTGLRAGQFADPAKPLTPPVQGPELEKISLLHLTPEPVPSPFISTYQTFLPTFHRAVKNQNNAAIAIIDFGKVEKSLRARFPRSPEIVFLVPRLVKEFGFQLRGGYTGTGEWLIWACVEPSAIVSIINLADIVEAAKQTPEIAKALQIDLVQKAPHTGILRSWLAKSATMKAVSYSTGETIGRLLRKAGVPDSVHELLAWRIAIDWQFIGSSAAKGNGDYEDFMNGVFAATGSVRGSSILSENDMWDDSDLEARDPEEDNTASTAVLAPPIQGFGRWEPTGPMTTTTTTPGFPPRIFPAYRLEPQHMKAAFTSQPIAKSIESMEQDDRFAQAREASPAFTVASVPDTFTIQVRQKAEECSVTPVPITPDIIYMGSSGDDSGGLTGASHRNTRREEEEEAEAEEDDDDWDLVVMEDISSEAPRSRGRGRPRNADGGTTKKKAAGRRVSGVRKDGANKVDGNSKNREHGKDADDDDELCELDLIVIS